MATDRCFSASRWRQALLVLRADMVFLRDARAPPRSLASGVPLPADDNVN
jgi:hypothetical protein